MSARFLRLVAAWHWLMLGLSACALAWTLASVVTVRVHAQDLNTLLTTFLAGLRSGQVRALGPAAPTCTTNCGTSPSVDGSDTAMVVTMGATGSPASGWVVTFNATWASAPSCVVQMAKTGMVVGKLALTAVASTTTVTVVTNGTAPANADVYAVHCFGVS